MFLFKWTKLRGPLRAIQTILTIQRANLLPIATSQNKIRNDRGNPQIIRLIKRSNLMTPDNGRVTHMSAFHLRVCRRLIAKCPSRVASSVVTVAVMLLESFLTFQKRTDLWGLISHFRKRLSRLLVLEKYCWILNPLLILLTKPFASLARLLSNPRKGLIKSVRRYPVK